MVALLQLSNASSPMEVTDEGIMISVNAVQSLNVFLPSTFIVPGMLTCFRELQFMKAPQSTSSLEMLPHFVSATPSEITTSVKEVHILKAPAGMIFSLPGMVTDFMPLSANAKSPISKSLFPRLTSTRFEQPINAALPIHFTLFGIETLRIEIFPSNALSPISLTSSGITTSLSVPLYCFSTPFSMTNSLIARADAPFSIPIILA